MINHFEYDIDLEKLGQLIYEASDLNDNDEFFSKLSEVYKVKENLNDLLDRIKTIEASVVGTIKTKATNLYGNNWKSISGNGYKITRSETGSVYELIPDVKINTKFIKIVKSPDTKLIDEFIESHDGKLPAGIGINKNRNESIRVTIK